MSAGDDRPISDGPAHLVPGLFEVDGEGRARLLGSRCALCGESAFPRRQVCPRCKRRTMEPTLLSERGRLFSFTVCHSAPAGWRAPYLQAYVELPEGLRVFGLISDAVEPRSDALEVGMQMEVVVERVGDESADAPVTYKFRPLD
jgi:uncharacterized OB-fold protein